MKRNPSGPASRVHDEHREIERRFLVDVIPFALEGFTCQVIEQGYLDGVLGEVHLRIRCMGGGGAAVLTIKKGRGLSRTEVELALTPSQHQALWPLTSGRRLAKKRYLIPQGARLIQLDCYAGNLSGLMVAEVEFASEAEALAFPVPDWFGREVTEDVRYSNFALASAQSLP